MGQVKARTAIQWRTVGDSFASLPSQLGLSVADGAGYTFGGRGWILKKSGNYVTSLDLINGTGLSIVLSTTSSVINVGSTLCPIIWKNVADFFTEKQTPFRFAARFVPSSPGASTEVCGIAFTSTTATWGGNSFMATLGTIGGAAGARHHRNAGATVTNAATLAGSYNCVMLDVRAGGSHAYVCSSPDIVPLPDSPAWLPLTASTNDFSGSSINLDAASGAGFQGVAVGVGLIFGNGNTAGGQTMVCTGYKLAVCDNFSLTKT